MPCPTFQSLIDYVDGRLARDEAPEVERHLAAECGECRAAVAWYAGFAGTAREDTSVEPPSWVTRRAIGIFAEAKEAAARRGLRGLVSRLRAALVFDSMAGASSGDAIPARASAGPSRQLLYSAAPFDVDMLIAAGDRPHTLVVTGQVLTADGDDFESVRGLAVTLEREGEAVATAETSEFGEFTLPDLPPGLYELRL
jgi:hypothetical protein